jgi:hypothetical protein
MAGTGIAPDPGMNLFRLPAGSHHEVIRIPFKDLLRLTGVTFSSSARASKKEPVAPS